MSNHANTATVSLDTKMQEMWLIQWLVTSSIRQSMQTLSRASHGSSIVHKTTRCSHSNTVGWLRARFQICMLTSVSLSLSGSRTKWRGAGALDSVGIPHFEQ